MSAIEVLIPIGRRLFRELGQRRTLKCSRRPLERWQPPRREVMPQRLCSLNSAAFIQEVLVPAGTRLQRSRALSAFGQKGRREQFRLLEDIPLDAFGTGVPFP